MFLSLYNYFNNTLSKERIYKLMKNKGLVIFCSVLVGVCAAVAATLVIINYFKKKKGELEDTNYVFENDFEEDEAELVAE